jgi:hypothetical protein
MSGVGTVSTCGSGGLAGFRGLKSRNTATASVTNSNRQMIRRRLIVNTIP